MVAPVEMANDTMYASVINNPTIFDVWQGCGSHNQKCSRYVYYFLKTGTQHHFLPHQHSTSLFDINTQAASLFVNATGTDLTGGGLGFTIGFDVAW